MLGYTITKSFAILYTLLLAATATDGFIPRQPSAASATTIARSADACNNAQNHGHPASWKAAKTSSTAVRSADDSTQPSLSDSEQTVHDFLRHLHTSDLPFRIVVIGNGAILESTNVMGPKFKLNQSPKSGKNLVTFAADDASFEFHVMVADVAKVVLSERASPVDPDKTMRVLRMSNAESKPICSLILADQSEAAAKWFGGMVEKYGQEFEP